MYKDGSKTSQIDLMLYMKRSKIRYRYDSEPHDNLTDKYILEKK